MRLATHSNGNAYYSTTAAAPPRLIARPFFGPNDGIDFTDAVIRGIAARLRELYGGNDVLNTLEAERLLDEAIAALR